ncbi:MAG: ScpA family protein [Alphaproteobacteria bacterium]
MTETATSNEQEDGGSNYDLVVKLGNYDGPLDLLLNLAHEQKVDLGSISILALAEQYLAYITTARRLRLEVAGDYLVMAAWLAYLKSRLLLPAPPGEEPDPASLAAALKFQLLRLEAMQKAAAQLAALPQLGTEIFLRGIPEPIRRIEKPVYHLPLYDLLQALAAPQRRTKSPSYALMPQWRLFSMEDALVRLRGMIGFMPEWAVLTRFMPKEPVDDLEARSAVASTFAATLEMVKLGEVELRQDANFGPIYLRKAKPENEEIRQ